MYPALSDKMIMIDGDLLHSINFINAQRHQPIEIDSLDLIVIVAFSSIVKNISKEM